MRLAIETGTDAGRVCCFDPAALPPDFDQRCKNDSVGTIDRLAEEGRFWWKGDGDGDYLIHFYVNEEVSPEILAVTEELEEVPRFHIPSGKLVACGVEYAAADPFSGSGATPKGGLDRFTDMGGLEEIPAGNYSFKAWGCDWPESVFAERMTAVLGDEGWRRHQRIAFYKTMIVCFLMLLCLVVLGATLISRARHALGATGLIAAWAFVFIFGAALPRLLSFFKSPGSPELEHRIEMEMPSIVIQLTRLPS